MYSLASHRRVVAVEVKFHITVVSGVILAFLAAFLFEIRDDGRVATRLLPWIPLPEVCMSRVWFHVDCPACGLTRSFIRLAEFDLSKSIAMHRLGWLVALFFAGQIPYRVMLLRRIRLGAATSARVRWPRVMTFLLLLAVLLNWGSRLAGF